MARQTLTKQTIQGPYPTLPVSANALDATFTAADVTNKEQFLASGDDLVLVHNSHASTAYTVTFTSAANAQQRTGDVGPYTIQAGEIIPFRFRKSGWMQSDGYIYMEANNAAIKYAVFEL